MRARLVTGRERESRMRHRRGGGPLSSSRLAAGAGRPRRQAPKDDSYQRYQDTAGFQDVRKVVATVSAPSSAGKFEEQMSDIRGYVPGALRTYATERASQRIGPSSARTRIALVGEFGAGKSSLLNTIWHVLTAQNGDSFHKVAHTAQGPQSATSQPRSVIYQPDLDSSFHDGTFTLWDTPGFKEFSERELHVMRSYVENGIRERQDTLGLVQGTQRGYPGDVAVDVDHFVWVFGMHRLGALGVSAPTSSSSVPRLSTLAADEIAVTRKGLERSKQGRELFNLFFQCARTRSAGAPPSIVLTHVDGFSAEDVATAKGLIQSLTQVDPHDITTISCYRSEWCPPPSNAATDHAAVHIVHTALCRADDSRDLESNHIIVRLGRLFASYTHDARVLLWHLRRSRHVASCLLFLLLTFLTTLYFFTKWLAAWSAASHPELPA